MQSILILDDGSPQHWCKVSNWNDNRWSAWDWCEKNIGRPGDKWDYFGGGRFMFAELGDCILFKLLWL